MTHYDDFRTHRRSRRLASYDYAAEGWYFVTIGTEHCRSYFGTIRNGIMGLNEMGCIAHSCWTKIPDHIRDVDQGAFIVMPNHVHALIGLGIDVTSTPPRDASDVTALRDVSDVTPLHATALRGAINDRDKLVQGARPIASPRAGSLAVVVRSYKSAVTRTIRADGFDFAWQARYHDHIVRDEESLFNIHRYIIDNPASWTNDRYHR